MSQTKGKPLTRAELQDEVTRRAIDDPEFRQAVVADPRGTLMKSFDIDLPDAIQLKVVVDSSDTSYLVVPAEPCTEGELEDQALDAVAGGLLHLSAHSGHTT